MSSATHHWQGPTTRVDKALQDAGLARSRSSAQQLISGGAVLLDGAHVVKSGAKISAGQVLTLQTTEHYVSRGAHKLIAALDHFEVTVEGRIALDVGASTGGFTQVLLERGAAMVLAIDVGHGQLAHALAVHERVRLYEGCNARYVTRDELREHTGVGDPPSVVVGDLSFISLTQVLPALSALMADGADLVMLIKPQFEVGKAAIGSGVVTDEALQLDAIRRVIASASEHELDAHGLTSSPILGGQGNREFLVHLRRHKPGAVTVTDEMMAQVVYDGGSVHGDEA